MNLKTLVILTMTTPAAPSIAMANGVDINVEHVEGNLITVFGRAHISTHASIVIGASVDVVWATVMDEDTTLFVQSDDTTSTDPMTLDLPSEQVVSLVKTIAEKNYMAFNLALKAEAKARHQAQ